MKTILRCALFSIIAAVLLSGCSLTREPVRYRDDYFRPVTAVPQRGSTVLPSNDVEQLRAQLQLANHTVSTLLDSLKSMQNYTGLLLVSTRSLVDKVNELESKESMAVYKQRELEQSVVALQSENKDFSKQLNELRRKLFAGNVKAEPQVFSPAGINSSFRDEYSEGVSLFMKKKYEEARATFEGLIDRGIEETLVDNCEYWIGECKFAKRDFFTAIQHFQKVIAMDSSNKKPDAYFMLGKSYEQVGDLAKARWAYEELSLVYPNNSHARYVKSRLNAIKHALPLPVNGNRKKTSA
jgi:TolA-binding protein